MTLEEMVRRAISRIDRYEPRQAHDACAAGALLVDIRSHRDRERGGVIPGAVHVPRTVFEWRLAPDSEWRNPHVGDLERPTIVICNQGYSSILAAAALTDLGYSAAGDVVGGFDAWVSAGLPTTAGPEPDPEQLDGMGPIDH